MRTLTVVESAESALELTDNEAAALQSLGRRLVGTSSWWGEQGHEQPRDRSVLRCAAKGDGRWQVWVRDVVGVLVVGDLQILVQPKIPVPHLLHLFAAGGYLPRLDSSPVGQMGQADSLWQLIATWFQVALERVLRAELVRDYEPAREPLRMLRGRIDPAATTADFYRGRLELTCEFEEFGFDSPVNRVLKAAARQLVSAPNLEPALRRRAARALSRMDAVGQIRRDDEPRAVVDRRTHHYSAALHLARHVLNGRGRNLHAGAESVWTFLIRTPEPVEAGLRELLREALPDQRVRKAGIALGSSGLTLNPDLVFGPPSAIGDVKYKILGSHWDRADLYQLVAFASGYGVVEAVLFGFSTTGVALPPTLTVGETRVSTVAWPAGSGLDPEQARRVFVAAARDRLGRVDSARTGS